MEHIPRWGGDAPAPGSPLPGAPGMRIRTSPMSRSASGRPHPPIRAAAVSGPPPRRPRHLLQSTATPDRDAISAADLP
ncbi:hypothetical protein CTheo_9262 [Ceratobasidium theobromae]|uniref:Uncharacterized protein n=1 Tax=Ceratobasidium theobromae TaxID=1582974 RepID=A0A5N5Q745_9AGAM|nr:hypothetical protein CTheo_9262 [Ceratobasidium theobromae]